MAKTLMLYLISFKKEEMYNLAEQIRRAVDSVALNISEGLIGQTNPENRKFIGYSIRSLAETITCPHKAKRRAYISEQKFSANYEFVFNLMNMIIAYRNKLN